jgi:hypothetical protein
VSIIDLPLDPNGISLWVAQTEQIEEAAACELLCRTGQLDEKPFHDDDCPVGHKLRDAWCTPKWLTELLPLVTLDPCANPFSTVRARNSVVWEQDDNKHLTVGKPGVMIGDGLAVSWKNKSVFCNPPYSGIMPWARKADEARAFIYLVNNVTTTKWYRELVHNGGSYKFEFDKRLKFDPPPRIKQSSNSRDQVLVCNREGWKMIGNKLDGYGRWWVEHVGYVEE